MITHKNTQSIHPFKCTFCSFEDRLNEQSRSLFNRVMYSNQPFQDDSTQNATNLINVPPLIPETVATILDMNNKLIQILVIYQVQLFITNNYDRIMAGLKVP